MEESERLTQKRKSLNKQGCLEYYHRETGIPKGKIWILVERSAKLVTDSGLDPWLVDKSPY